jgi:ABC-2 type transport system ATP-binding protein
MIEVHNLSKTFNQVRALNNISFRVKDGEILGFLGPNGAGKTTTMRIITGYTAPSAGSVKINGLEVSEHPIETKRQIGYSPETVPLYDDMTVLEYLKFIASIRLRAGRREGHDGQEGGLTFSEAIKNVVLSCGLNRVINRPIGQLSKGYRQRTCLAQALLGNPQILVLDEPTSGLDPNQIMEIRNMIREIGKERTVILSTHILQEVQALCNRVIIINEGKLVAQGTVDELERQAQGKQSVYVKMKGLKEKIHQLLLDLPQAEEVNHRDTEGMEMFGFEIVVRGDADVRESIFHRAVEARTPILEMRLEKVSLEDVFRRLTQ